MMKDTVRECLAVSHKELCGLECYVFWLLTMGHKTGHSGTNSPTLIPAPLSSCTEEVQQAQCTVRLGWESGLQDTAEGREVSQ